MLVTRADHEDAARLAAEAGALLLDIRRRLDDGEDPAVVRRAGDLGANELILKQLAAQHSEDAVLSEESIDDRRRLDATRVWIVDPLDGTREFGEPGRTDWAVHVALCVDGTAVAGAVALPAEDLVLSTADPPPAPANRHTGIRLAVSRTRPPACAEAVADALGASLVPMGSAGAKAMAVVRGEVDAYVHAGGQYEWDSAAPVAVANAAGLHVSRLDGSPPRYNQPDPSLPDLVVCRAELAEAVLAALAGNG